MTKPLKLIFMGTPDFAVPSLQTLIDSEHEVVAVYCQPPRPAGRGKKERASAIQILAEKHDLPVHYPTTLKESDTQKTFKSHGADVAIVAAYGLLLPQEILEACPMGCLNIHPSHLPRWRGAAPIQRTIMSGDCETSIVIMQMDKGLDTGDMLLTRDYDIPSRMTAGELHDMLAEKSGKLVLQTLEGLQNGKITPTPQPKYGVEYADKISKDERPIDWTNTAEEIHNHIRGLSPYPTATFEYKGETIKVLRSEHRTNLSFARAGTVLSDRLAIACGDGGVIRLTTLQRAGKKPMNAEEFIRGFAIEKGDNLISQMQALV